MKVFDKLNLSQKTEYKYNKEYFKIGVLMMYSK